MKIRKILGLKKTQKVKLKLNKMTGEAIIRSQVNFLEFAGALKPKGKQIPVEELHKLFET